MKEKDKFNLRFNNYNNRLINQNKRINYNQFNCKITLNKKNKLLLVNIHQIRRIIKIEQQNCKNN